MTAVLTTSSKIQCYHEGSPIGTVTLTPSTKLKVNGSPVLVKSDLGLIPDCTHQSSSWKKDTAVNPATVTGDAGKLKADGNGVLLESMSGKGDGAPPGDLKATAKQSLLKGA